LLYSVEMRENGHDSGRNRLRKRLIASLTSLAPGENQPPKIVVRLIACRSKSIAKEREAEDGTLRVLMYVPYSA